MAREFSPDDHVQRLQNDVTGYEWYLSWPLEDTAETGGVGSSAAAFLSDAVRCLLVNLDDPAAPLLAKTREWITYAMDAKEAANNVEALAISARRHETLALCDWLERGAHNQDELTRFVIEKENYYQIKDGKSSLGVSLGIAPYVDAQAWDICDKRLDIAGIRAPTSLSGLRTEGGLAKIICCHHLRNEYSADEVQQAIERGLKQWMNRWLAYDGAYTRAAHWLKIAHWHKNGPLTPKQTIMKAYDYLPGVMPPT